MAKIKNSYPKPLMLTHDLIGGKWKLRIIKNILLGNNRYSLLRKGIPEITEKVLTEQLRDLVENGLLQKNIIEDYPPRIIEYSLGNSYRELEDLVEHICTFTTYYASMNKISFHD